jgi:hypothetical protein
MEVNVKGFESIYKINQPLLKASKESVAERLSKMKMMAQPQKGFETFWLNNESED